MSRKNTQLKHQCPWRSATRALWWFYLAIPHCFHQKNIHLATWVGFFPVAEELQPEPTFSWHTLTNPLGRPESLSQYSQKQIQGSCTCPTRSRQTHYVSSFILHYIWSSNVYNVYYFTCFKLKVPSIIFSCNFSCKTRLFVFNLNHFLTDSTYCGIFLRIIHKI